MSAMIDWSRVPDEFVVYDLETTGLDATTDDILEIGAIRFNKERYIQTSVIDTFQTFIKRETAIPPEITRINGITDQMVSEGNTLEKALKDFFKFAGQSKLVAFNAPFDEDFIELSCERINLELPRRLNTACVLYMARKRISGLPNYKLRTLAKALNIDPKGSHQAVNDCVTTLRVYVNILN